MGGGGGAQSVNCCYRASISRRSFTEHRLPCRVGASVKQTCPIKFSGKFAPHHRFHAFGRSCEEQTKKQEQHSGRRPHKELAVYFCDELPLSSAKQELVSTSTWEIIRRRSMKVFFSLLQQRDGPLGPERAYKDSFEWPAGPYAFFLRIQPLVPRSIVGWVSFLCTQTRK